VLAETAPDGQSTPDPQPAGDSHRAAAPGGYRQPEQDRHPSAAPVVLPDADRIPQPARNPQAERNPQAVLLS